MSSYEKDLEEITNSETLTPLEELKISAPIYFRNNIANRNEFIAKLAKKMKLADNTAYVYFMSMLTGKLYENMPPTYFKIMKKTIDILKAPEYLTDLLKQAKKQPVKTRQKIIPVEKHIETEVANEEINDEPNPEEYQSDPGYEIVSDKIKTLSNNTKVSETTYANGTRIQIPHPLPNEEHCTGRTYIPNMGWVYGPYF